MDFRKPFAFALIKTTAEKQKHISEIAKKL